MYMYMYVYMNVTASDDPRPYLNNLLADLPPPPPTPPPKTRGYMGSLLERVSP